ncbi:U-box domain-containing protein kinase family protein [Arabidopsis thaliana]|uniref:Isoform 2 of Putative U-box domain-containing protein 50 n=1 Tax=Arabidopsis thaliana TaxID=3702 RepID=Q9FGD7-2|nr:U-box domain-containing protein kinase family protein [Arabidopsis thaliana]AED98064.1 U-box domain-containing protein kinase family protein [Arabidopsis thaliana]|eukprot:NP_201353.4 U-box domain-containing protein kinase family protein [Arabidopsis thaliana]
MEETKTHELEVEAESGSRMEKVYIAVGNDVQEGYKTIHWALKKWNNIPISIVLLHLCNISQDFVYTPFGKLPASSVSEEKLQVLRKYEDQKIDKLLSKYITFCGKVKAELLKVEKQHDSIQVLILDLISKLRITKLVMGITFMRSSSSWKSKSAISGSFYVYQNKPEFCEFYIICGGKMVSLKNDVNNNNSNIRSWIGKMFHDPGRNLDRSSGNNDDPTASGSSWDKNLQEIENYFQQLLSLNLAEEETENVVEEEQEDDDDVALNVLQHMVKILRKVNEAKLMIDEKSREVKVNAERSNRAEWAISLCNSRIGEFEAWIKEESERREKLQATLDSDKECIEEAKNYVEKGKTKLHSLAELQEVLSSKVKTMMEAKSQAEVELERVVLQRGEMITEIEKLRSQRDVFNRRIEFCKEREVIGSVSKEEVKCGYREYVAEDIRLATETYSDRLRLKSGGNWTNVYRGRIKHTTVAVKVIGDSLSDEAFGAKVKLLNEIRHPNLVAIAGFCSQRPKCLLFEYMHNGNLRDNLFTSQRKSRRSKILKWHDRIRIAHQVCSGLGFLHSVKPKPIVHGRLTPSKILLDRNLVPKITGFGLIMHSDQSDTKPDVMAFGVLLLHLLTGRNWHGLLKAMSMNQTSILRDLDQTAGKWPLELAKEFGALAVKCSSVNRGGNMDFSTKEIMEELGKIREKADEFKTKGGYEEATNSNMDEGDPNDIPSVFMCPILQEVMKNPHVAADGFSYELEAIQEWLSMGHDTSPMTNLRLDYQMLTPNHTLRSLIQDWHSKRAAQASS